MASRASARSAIRKCEHWMIEHLKHSDGLGAIYPPMMYAIMAFDALGYAPDHPMRKEAVRQFDALLVDDGQRFFFQPCFSPVWDSAIASYALGEAGAQRPAICGAARIGCWRVRFGARAIGASSAPIPSLPAGPSNSSNDHYPDIDDTAMVLLSFAHARGSNPAAQAACEKRALNWLLAMQGRDGGWAAFDVDNNWQILSYVPFADHNAMLDPNCADITGRVLEALAAQRFGPQPSRRAARRGLPDPHPNGGRQLVRALGRRLHLRHLFRFARVARQRGRRPRTAHAARQRMAAFHSERRWRLGRKLRQL